MRPRDLLPLLSSQGKGTAKNFALPWSHLGWRSEVTITPKSCSSGEDKGLPRRFQREP